jgi:hypothetical protein
MPDYTGLLSNIASALEQIAGSPNYFWVAPIAVLLSAVVGYMASQRVIKKQRDVEASRERDRKKLAFKLLKDEIILRWQCGIEPFLRELLDKEPVLGLQRFSRMTLREDDIFVIRSISSSFSDYYFFENEELVSKIIHGYLLYTDLIDFQSTVRRFLNERSERQRVLIASLQEVEAEKRLNEELSNTVNDLWSRFQPKLDEINFKFRSVFDEISNSVSQSDLDRKLSIAEAARVISVTQDELKKYIGAGRIHRNPDGTIDTGELLRAGLIIRNWPPRS